MSKVSSLGKPRSTSPRSWPRPEPGKPSCLPPLRDDPGMPRHPPVDVGKSGCTPSVQTTSLSTLRSWCRSWAAWPQETRSPQTSEHHHQGKEVL